MPIGLKAITPKKFGTFDVINRTKLTANVKRGMRVYLEEIKEELQADYGRVDPSPRYNRTYDMYNSWEIHVSADGSEGNLVNTNPYAVYVQGPRGGGRGPGERQSQLQRARGWKSITDVARRNRRFFTSVMNRAVSPRVSRGEEGFFLGRPFG